MQGEVFNQSTWVVLKAHLYYKQINLKRNFRNLASLIYSSRLLKEQRKHSFFCYQEPYAECLELKRNYKPNGLKGLLWLHQ